MDAPGPRTVRRPPVAPWVALLALAALAAACGPGEPPADLLLTGGRVYTLAWSEPAPDGTPAADAPYDPATGWHPDAEAVAVRGGRIVFVGPDAQAERYRGPQTRVVDVAGATVLPGLVDAHTHVAGLGRNLSRVDLRGVEDEEEVAQRVAAAAAGVPAGRWIEGWGWDEGAWASHYPDFGLLSERVPEHPVILRGLHSYATWGNRLAFERAGIDRDTPDPEGGTILRDGAGDPTGVLLNRAGALLDAALPAPPADQLRNEVATGLRAMAEAGYTAIHEAGADSALTAAFEELEAAGELPIRVHLMLAARDPQVLERYRARGPDLEGRLVVRSVKAFYDGALGSRGALLSDDYADRPGHQGVGGADNGFDPEPLATMMAAGFQVAVHAIGDAANRATLDFFEGVFAAHPETRAGRHRIEHAQVLHPGDLPRFAELGVIASMQPVHAVEDMRWAADRLGPERLAGAYAWRSVRRTGAHLVLSSDLPGSDHSIFYGLHAAVTRRDKAQEPPGGWRPEERLTPEEALRGYTTWAAWAAFTEDQNGTIEPGKRADLTVLRPDPLALPVERYGEILDGEIGWTVVDGEVAYEAE